MVTEQIADQETSELRYEVRLLIRHPNIDPDRITETLGSTPHLSAMAGGVRKAPNGVILAGHHKFSVWSYCFDVEGNRLFFSDIGKMIDRLEPHKAFLAEIVDGGGSIELAVNLPGDINIGDSLSWRDLARLSALQIDLGIEVFPDYNS